MIFKSIDPNLTHLYSPEIFPFCQNYISTTPTYLLMLPPYLGCFCILFPSDSPQENNMLTLVQVTMKTTNPLIWCSWPLFCKFRCPEKWNQASSIDHVISTYSNGDDSSCLVLSACESFCMVWVLQGVLLFATHQVTISCESLHNDLCGVQSNHSQMPTAHCGTNGSRLCIPLCWLMNQLFPAFLNLRITFRSGLLFTVLHIQQLCGWPQVSNHTSRNTPHSKGDALIPVFLSIALIWLPMKLNWIAL